MSIKLADCVRETTTTTGTGTLTLSGTAPAIGDRTFSTSVSAAGVDDLTNGCTTVIRIEAVDGSGNPTGDWEITEAVYAVSGNTVTRATFRASSTGSRVSFSAGTKYVSVVAPASLLQGGGFTSWNETPSGTMNGVNQTFTLAGTPSSGKLLLAYNGAVFLPTVDYTLVGSTITLLNVFPNSASNDVLAAFY